MQVGVKARVARDVLRELGRVRLALPLPVLRNPEGSDLRGEEVAAQRLARAKRHLDPYVAWVINRTANVQEPQPAPGARAWLVRGHRVGTSRNLLERMG